MAFILTLDSPKIFFDVAGEGGLLKPAAFLEGLEHVALDVGSQRAGTVVILVATLAGIDIDEMVLDGTLQTAWHIVIDSGEAVGHANGFVLAKQWTVFALHLGVTEVDAGGVEPFRWFVVAENAVEAVHTQRADVTVAGLVVVCLFGKDFFAAPGSIVVLCHSCCYFVCKVNKNTGGKQIFF